jgi:ribose 5-phosphate isomerase A
MPHEEEKQAAARASLRFVRDGRVVGLGSGSTATYAIQYIGERVKQGLEIRAIASSVRSRDLADSLGIPLTTLDESPQIDVYIDGADEFDPQLRLIKGGGGALLREKILASAAAQFVVIADSSKQVQVLGTFPLPVEIVPFAQPVVSRTIERLGARVTLRKYAYGNPYTTDEGHQILDCRFGEIADPARLAGQLKEIPGIVEHGLFIDMAAVVLVANGERVTELRRDQRAC